ncbi:LysM peptidoglycan-binding domain-containing protein [Candidatus Halobeggiatoa sp. HSG11]|nr:LysM peptidoglycan-binding domain-containing protein [Candidatus Halobeggiatoa sp. HSG11]
MKSTIKLYLVLSGLVLFQACTIHGQRPQINHSVKPGESLATIANFYGCRNHMELASINSIPYPYNVYTSQNVIIPADICNVMPQPPQHYPQSTPDYYTAVKGDNLYNIAKTYSISVGDLATWNRLEPPYTLPIGQQLRVTPPQFNNIRQQWPPGPTITGQRQWSPPVTEQPITRQPARLKPRYHIVTKGENLYRISRKYGYSYQTVAEWNGLSKPYILSIGRKLIVSPPNNSNYDYPAETSTYYEQDYNTRGYNASPSYNPNYTTGYYNPNPGYNVNHATNYIVRPGETLENVANRHGLTVENLSAWNGLGGPYSIHTGQILRLTPPP